MIKYLPFKISIGKHNNMCFASVLNDCNNDHANDIIVQHYDKLLIIYVSSSKLHAVLTWTLTQSSGSGFCWLKTGRPNVWTDAVPLTIHSSGRLRNCRPTEIWLFSATTGNKTQHVMPRTFLYQIESLVSSKLLDIYR